jgi:hypothetical protein
MTHATMAARLAKKSRHRMNKVKKTWLAITILITP